MEILKVAEATAEGIRKVSEALSLPGGSEAASIEVAKLYIAEFGKLAKENNTMILPASLTDMSSMVATAMATFTHVNKGDTSSPNGPEVRSRT